MNSHYPCVKAKTKTQGLSLLELAIVLGVIGIIGGAIWGAVSQVNMRQRIEDTVNVTSVIALNVRGVYAGFPKAPAPSVARQISSGLFPASVLNSNGTGAVNAWGGAITLNFDDSGGDLRGFSIAFSFPADGMTNTDHRDACIGVVSRLRGTATNYAANAFTVEGFPNTPVPLNSLDEASPSLSLVKNGPTWRNATTASMSKLFSGNQDCTDFAFYYRL